MVYYNEFDAKKAAWLRELIARGLIAKGEVDERTIRDVQPGDLRGFAQCHFFAGIGIWSYALRLAGWPDDRPVWTASCPCQPFSAAGKRKGTADERHLWPELFRLIRECRPVVAIGEQVAGGDGLAWLDIVRSDLDECLYTCGHVVSPACGYGAPHRRERLYWCALADSTSEGLEGATGAGVQWRSVRHSGDSTAGGVVDGDGERRAQRLQRDGEPEHRCETGGERLDAGGSGEAVRDGCTGDWDTCDAVLCNGCEWGRAESDRVGDAGRSTDARGLGWDASSSLGATRGFWAGADWVLARPQRLGDPPSLRPIEPGSFPLADGAPARVVRLRGYGDAIVAPQAAAFIRAIMEEL